MFSGLPLCLAHAPTPTQLEWLLLVRPASKTKTKVLGARNQVVLTV